jgi:hypothetical protein
METNNNTFWELISHYKINIPIIQRDYAQGRDEEEVKREKFLNVIFGKLNEEKSDNPLDLDFVYGRIKDNVFYPIDGQQRLTTLFLLHWYLSVKENILEVEKNKLIKFVYDTRISSREFCKSLIEEKIEIPTISSHNNFIDQIQDYHWFRSIWKKDPTIKAMLTMIQAIHEKTFSIPSNKFWDRLTKERCISFEVLDLGAKGFELTDELYIKMNSRGKQLTQFENFKANFIQFVEKNYNNKQLNHPIKGAISFAGYFSYKIEKEWTDLFWGFRENSSTIDNSFINYFSFVAQMCYFKTNKNVNVDDFKNTFNQYEEIFKVEDNLLFLFNSLDLFHNICSKNEFIESNSMNLFFKSILQKGPIDNKHNAEVRLFWNSSDEDSNLFKKCINKGLTDDARNKIILYCIIHYMLKHDITEVNDGLKYYLRVIRNLIQATRQKNETRYNTNIRINEFGSYWMLFQQLATQNVYETLQGSLNNEKTSISDKNIENEIIKARIINDTNKKSIFSLEEFHYFGGLINQLKIQDCIEKLDSYSKAIREIWNKGISDTLIIQSLIACGFEGVYTKDCRMGEMWYFGKHENWSFILTNTDKDFSKIITLLLDSYLIQSQNSAIEKLKAIVDNWLQINKEDISWRYYFLKYPEFTSKLNYYSWSSDYEIRILGTEGSNPLVAYHISPFVLTVCYRINDINICNINNCYQQYSGHSPLILSNGIKLTSTNDGWLINDENNVISQEIKDCFCLENNLLKSSQEKDRIQIAVDFIKKNTRTN